MIDLQKLDLRKKIVYDLSKSKGIETQKAQVILCMDISGSMTSLYHNDSEGSVQDLLERIVPIAMQFDDNQEFELYLFSNNCTKHKNNVTLNNIEGIVQREIYRKYDMSGTSYTPPIQRIVKENATGKEVKAGFFGKTTYEPIELPVYVIFITDGDNNDHAETEKALIHASKFGAFFQFVGIGRERFSFLQRLDNLPGRTIDNANFFSAGEIKNMSDEQLYSKLLGEFPDWLKLAKQHKIVK